MHVTVRWHNKLMKPSSCKVYLDSIPTRWKQFVSQIAVNSELAEHFHWKHFAHRVSSQYIYFLRFKAFGEYSAWKYAAPSEFFWVVNQLDLFPASVWPHLRRCWSGCMAHGLAVNPGVLYHRCAPCCDAMLHITCWRNRYGGERLKQTSPRCLLGGNTNIMIWTLITAS